MGGSDCEVLGGGWLAQPTNAWSSLAFAAAALAVVFRGPLVVVLVSDSRAIARKSLTRTHVWVGAAALVLVAVGSFAYHGPQPSWARGAHDGSIVVLVVVVAALLTARRSGLDARMLTVAAVAIALGGVAWFLGRTDGPLCAPSSWFQWHAVWHVLAATAAASALVATTAPGWRSAGRFRRARAPQEREQPA